MGSRRRKSQGARASISSDPALDRFVSDVVAIRAELGTPDERVLKALRAIRGGLDTSSIIARYLKLTPAIDAAAATSVPAATVLAGLAPPGSGIAQLIDAMLEADELVSFGIGIPAVASLLASPQREFRAGDVTILAGVFAPDYEPQSRCAVVMRWKTTSHGGFHDVAFVDLDERALEDEGSIEDLLVDIAEEASARPLKTRARALLVVGPQTNVELESVRCRMMAIAAVRQVAIDVVHVVDNRNLTQLDRVLSDGGYDVLLLWIEGGTRWAWKRRERFLGDGGQAAVVSGPDITVASADVRSHLHELLEGPGLDGGEDGEHPDVSSLSEIEQAEVRKSLEDRAITIAFVGGNETQSRRRAAVETDLEQRFGGRVVMSWHSGWGSNWEATRKRVGSELAADAEALVLMPLVRTGLGAGLRKAAGAAGRPWVACTGNGRQSMQQAIEQALLVAIRGRA